jgi:hypothetical protein
LLLVNLIVSGGDYFLKQKEYIKITGVIFTTVAAIHAWRLISGFEVIIGGIEIPYWASIVGVAVAGFLAYTSQNLKK